MIQFECPHCQAILKVPDSAMGQKGKCPQCQMSLLVPTPPELAEGHAAPAVRAPMKPTSTPAPSHLEADSDSWTHLLNDPPQQAPKTADEAVDELFSALSDEAIPVREDPLISVTKRSQRHNIGSAITACLFIGISILFAGGVYWFVQPRMQGELAAQLVKADILKPRVLSPQQMQAEEAFAEFLRTHAEDRIHINSQQLLTSLEATPKGLEVRITPGAGFDIYRVNLLANTALRDYYIENDRQLDQIRLAELRTGVRDFFARMKTAEDVLRSNSYELLQYRDRIILPAIVDGLGFCLIAITNNTQYPCIWQDNDDFLYFALPKGTKSFVVQERVIDNRSRFFPASMKFEITTDRTTAPVPKGYNYDHMFDDTTTTASDVKAEEESSATTEEDAEPMESKTNPTPPMDSNPE